MKKRILAILLAMCMALSLVPSYAVEAEESINICYIELGIPKKEAGGKTYTFPGMKLRNEESGKTIAYANVAFSSAIASGDTIHLSADGTRFADIFGVEETAETNSLTVTVKTGQTADNAAWLAFLKENLSVTLNNPEIEYSITITCSDDESFAGNIDGYLYRASTNHYYKFVEHTDISWTDAYEAAKGENPLGMQGYLMTITSKEEQEYVESIIAKPG